MKRHQRESCTAAKLEGNSTYRQNDGSEQHQPKRMKISRSATAKVMCSLCNIELNANMVTSHNRSRLHRDNACVAQPQDECVYKIHSAFKCRIASYRITAKKTHTDYTPFFNDIKDKALRLIENELIAHRCLKMNTDVFALYYLQTQDITEIKSFHAPNSVVDEGSEVGSLLDIFCETMITKAHEFEENKSGWSLLEIKYLEININKYTPMGGSTYMKLPKFIENKKAVLNIKNSDQYCFLWSIMAALFPVNDNSTITSSYPDFREVLNLDKLDFPMKLKDISKFESLNNISVNVYGLESAFENDRLTYEIVGPLRYAPQKLNTHVNLLLIVDDEMGKNHYCLIRNMSRLLSSQLSKHQHRKHICDGCLLCFSSEQKLMTHQRNDCNHIFTVVPSSNPRINKYGETVPENKLKFEHFERQLIVPFVVYGDFESVLVPISTCDGDPTTSYTNPTFKHEAHSFAYYIKCGYDDSKSKFVSYRGKNADIEFVQRLESDLKDVFNKYLDVVVPMAPLTPDEEMEFKNADKCAICGRPFTSEQVKVRDHCHLTGKKRFGAAHATCNLNFKVPSYIPVIMHNLSNYDTHLFIKNLSLNSESIDVIAQTKEKYISYTKNVPMGVYVNACGQTKTKMLKMRFIDSYRFLAASLQELGDNLKSEQMVETLRQFPDPGKFNLMRQKGIFPYNFVDSLAKLDYDSLPAKEDFYNQLIEEHISDEDYARASAVWDMFECKTLGDYSDIYLKSDVFLLADVFQNFRQQSIETYNLDPAHYYGSPGLAWDAALYITNVELDLLTDIEMIYFLKRGIRGGISQCSKRVAVANNKFLPEHRPDKEQSMIIYTDITNMYGHIMCQSLPTSDFKWSTSEMSETDILKIAEDSEFGYIFDVDIEYPEHLHDDHSDLPFLVENVIPPNAKSDNTKLIPNLFNKENYVVHYRTLQQALQHGLVLKKINRTLCFKQSKWLKKYVDLNTSLRNKATNKFGKNFYKTMVNATFGKSLENINNRRNIKLLSHWERRGHRIGAAALIARPNFKSCSIFNEHLVAIHSGVLKIRYDKPTFTGFSILDISKTILYRFYYDIFKKEYGNKVSLLYCDTDSLIIDVNTDDFFTFMQDNIEHFDTSNYKPGNQFGMPVTTPTLGNMKNEFPDDPIISFYGTGAKAYCVKTVQMELKRAKGVKKSVVEKNLCSADYENIALHGGLIFRKMNTFRSVMHDIYTETKNKVAISYHDDKRFLVPNSCGETLPHGHYAIRKHINDATTNNNLNMLISLMEAELEK